MIETNNRPALTGAAWAIAGIVVLAGVGLAVSLTARWLWSLVS